MAHARQPLSPCLRERGQIIFQSVIPFPLLATTSSLPFFFSFFFSSLLLFPSLFPSPTTEPRGLDTVVRSLCEGWRARGGNGMNRCCCWFLGAGLFFFSLLLFFFFSISLSLWRADYRGKLNFCNVRTSGGVRNSSFERSIDIGFRFVVVASILGATRFRPCTSCTLRED